MFLNSTVKYGDVLVTYYKYAVISDQVFYCCLDWQRKL